jgi:hypothetical protein
MERKVAVAIYDEDLSSLKELLLNGFEINQKYKYPIGCVRLFLDSFLKDSKIYL